MSNEQLRDLVEHDVLRPRLQFHELAGDHVTFDALAGTTAHEATVLDAVTSGIVTAVTGTRGGGKTSVIAYCCARLPSDLIALRVPVIAMDDPGDPATVAAAMITAALDASKFERYQREALETARADEITTHQTKPTARAKLGGGPIPAQLEGDLDSFAQEHRRDAGTQDRLRGLDRLITIFTARGARPLFVIEDTEAMVGLDEDVVTRFFARSLNMLAREIDAPTLIAIQDEFLVNPAFRELESGLRVVPVPRLEAPATAIARIAQHRITERADLPGNVTDLVSPDALGAFAEQYVDTRGSIRHTLAAVAASVEHAAEVGADTVGLPHARYGIAR